MAKIFSINLPLSFKTKLGTGLGKAYSVFCLSRFKGIISVAISADIIILIATF